jgi:hypothetical protein
VDQAIGDGINVFLRAGGANSDVAELVHNAMYSAKVGMEGHRFSLPGLQAGVAYAYLDGAANLSGDILHTRVFEALDRYPPGGILRYQR